jgi:hypothetical protein
MKNIILIVVLAFFSIGAFAQDKVEVKVKTEVNVENNDGKYHIKIVKEVDGEKTIIDKTYNSVEEMKNDPELEGIELHVLDGEGDMVFFSDDGEKGEHKIKIMIDGDSDVHVNSDGNHEFEFISEDGDSVKLQEVKVWVDEDGKKHVMKNGVELDQDEVNSWTIKDGEKGNVMFFKSGDDEGENQEIKVWIDEDGEKHVMKNGVAVDMSETSTWTNKEGNVMKVEKSDGKVMIISGDKVTEFKTENGEDVDLHFIGEESEDGKKHKVMIIESTEDGDGNEKRITVKVIEHITIHLEEVEENEFSDVANINAKVLKTDDLNYYPNPNSGKFSLEFKASKRPTEVKITSLEGKTVYSEELQNFEGTYQNEIDLSSQKRGVYLLQIIQGSKAVNKKIVIE